MNLKDEYESTQDWPADLDLQIDRICDAFELSYQRNERPRIEDYLDETLGEVETQLAELVLVDLVYRKKAGDTPSFDEYLSRFPTYSLVLKGLSPHFEPDSAGGYKTPPRVENLESFEFLGSGSFGAVWKAWDTKLHRFVAVKTPIRPVATQVDRELIQREARVVARAKHPYVVPVHSTGETDGRVYVVYEFVPGTTLKDRLSLEPFTPHAAAELCAKIAEAVHHVHQLGIVHRDLKPANILIDPAGDPHVMDFGLAKLLDAASTIGGTDHPLGTPAYMSPEQALGRSKETDTRSDIYSLGVILYELLSGKRVFSGSREELMAKILSSPPPKLSEHIPDVSPILQSICEKCLEKNKFDRYATAADLATDLQRYLNNESFRPRRIPRHVRFWRWLSQNRRWAILALLVLIPILPVLLLQLPAEPKASTQQPVKPSAPLPPNAHVVRVVTIPPGVTAVISPCDSKTGEPSLLNPVRNIKQTPDTTVLLPGQYLLHLTLQGPAGYVTHQVHRTVPGPGGLWPSMNTKWEQYKVLPTQEVEWPPVVMPGTERKFEMALIPGTDHFEVIRDGEPQIFKVLPFYVATREYTYGDFLKIRPGGKGSNLDKPATLQHPGDTMAVTYTFAEHWAEESGCRLLTDLEFAYLAHLAQIAQTKHPNSVNASDNYDQAGSATFDEIPTTGPPVRGILSGYAEWTSTWPTSPVATVRLESQLPGTHEPERFRIIRGGSIENSSQDYPRDPQSAAVSTIYHFHPHVGFRLARTPAPEILQEKKE